MLKYGAKALILGLISFAAFSSNAKADDQEEFSVEAYCVLANGKVSDQYLKVYESRLGSKPSAKVCASLKEVTTNLEGQKWDFRANRPYPGSAIRLSNEQVKLLREAQNSELSH